MSSIYFHIGRFKNGSSVYDSYLTVGEVGAVLIGFLMLYFIQTILFLIII